MEKSPTLRVKQRKNHGLTSTNVMGSLERLTAQVSFGTRHEPIVVSYLLMESALK